MPTQRKVPTDYDSDPERRRRTLAASDRYLVSGDVYEDVAAHFKAAVVSSVLDVGCGEGLLQPHVELIGATYLGIDSSPTQLEGAPENRVLGDATALPFPDRTFDGVAALYMLYHFDDPRVVVRECRRVLTGGGLFIACAPSYRDMPELAAVFRLDGPRVRSTFDAESGAEIVDEVFGNVRVESWDGPYIQLPDDPALSEYCRALGASAQAASRAPKLVETPLTVTKRGALLIATKRDRS